jgi:hypothetical protein
MLWTGLEIPTNPWSGTERSIIASIRMRVFGPPMTPDGPPLTGNEARRYFLQTADGVDEGYAAFYHERSKPDVVAVYGLRFADLRGLDWANLPGLRAHVVIMGSTVALVTGVGDECFDAVRGHVRSLRQ